MKKTYLLSYKADKFQPLQSGHFHFTLQVKTEWLLGLFTTNKQVKYAIPYNSNYSSFEKHWDNLISTKKRLK